MKNLFLALLFATCFGGAFAGELPATSRMVPPQTPAALGINVHAPNFLYQNAGETDQVYYERVLAEFKVIRQDFAAVRLSLNARDICDAQGIVHPWGARYVRTCLLAAKTAGLIVHITLPEPSTLEQGIGAHRYVMDTSAGIFPPSELSWSVRNEPELWAKGSRDPLTFDVGVADIAHWDRAKYNEKNYVLASATYAGWFFEVDPGLEMFYHLRFLWERFLENRIGFLQRTAQAFSFYVHPKATLEQARTKALAIRAMFRKHFTSHKLFCSEVGIRFDLYPSTETEYMKGKRTGQLLKMIREVFAEMPNFLYDYNGGNALSYRGRSEFQRGFRVGIR